MKKICPICTSELSKKWQLAGAANRQPMSQVLWNCSVCGAEFTRTELQASAKPPAKTALLTPSVAVGSIAFTKMAPKIPVE